MGISKCKGNCKDKEKCFRYSAVPQEYQYYSDFTPDDGEDRCKFFLHPPIKIKKEKI